jgi:ribosome-binding factor A
MSEHRQIQVEEMIAHLAAEFIERESNHQSLITITRADVSANFKDATVFFTVFPEKDEEHALKFMKRNRGDFRAFFKKRARLKVLPVFDFEIDAGEKNRQNLDEISKNT